MNRGIDLTRRVQAFFVWSVAIGVLAAGESARGGVLGDIFVIQMENKSFSQIAGSAAAPYLNSLLTPGNANAAQTSWTGNYLNVYVDGQALHPSLPNYIWAEAGDNFGITDDGNPYHSDGSVQFAQPAATESLTGLLQSSGISWRAYLEDTQINADHSGVLPQNEWTVPLNSVSGQSSSYSNAYNGSQYYDYVTKHVGPLYFAATSGGNDSTTANPQIPHYAPLSQLSADLANGNAGRYNLITPDEYNDMHTALPNGFTYNGATYYGVQAQIAQGDNFLSMIIPQIQASAAYQNNGAIVIWWDEATPGISQLMPEIVISPLAKGNAYDSSVSYTHSSDLKTWQELFGVRASDGGFLGDANTPGTNDLVDMFVPGALGPQEATVTPEPATWISFGLGLLGCLAARATSVKNALLGVPYHTGG